MKQSGTWRYYGGYQRISPGFDMNELGFQFTGDEQGAWAGLSYVQSRPRAIFRNFRVGVDGSWTWNTGGEEKGIWFRPVFFSATFKNNWELNFNPMAFEWNRFSVTALRGGPGLRQNTWRNSFLYGSTDSRKPVKLGLWAAMGSISGTKQRWATLAPELTIRPSGTVSASLEVYYNWSRDPEQWIGRRTVNDSTHYLLGMIEQQTLNVTARGTWTLSPTLSVQLFTQPFVSAGRYSNFKEAIVPGAERYEDRFRLYGNELTCSDGDCEVDLDRDGSADFSFGQPDFNYKSLRSTMVLRWEYRPGSVLFVAWQHGRSESLSTGSFGGFHSLADLSSLPSDNTVLIKLSYWLGL